METLFRFNIVRDARRSGDEVDPVDLVTTTQFQQSAAAVTGSNRRDQLRLLAESFIASPRFVTSVPARPDLDRLDRAAAAVDDLIASGQTTRDDVAGVLSSTLGAAPETFLSSAGLQADIDDVMDSILAIKLSPADHHRPVRRLAAVLRAFHLVRRFDDDPAFPADAAELMAAQRRTLRIAPAILPVRPTPPG